MDGNRADACEQRIRRIAPNAAVRFFRGDCNEQIHEIVRRIPLGALTLAFIDPQGLDIEFETVRLLTKRRRVDLLILVADAVDFARNVERTYLRTRDSKLDRFLGHDSEWRRKWQSLGNTEGPKARNFLADVYKEQLKRLGYVGFGEETMRRSKGPLYRMIFATKDAKGLELWDKVTKLDRHGQKELF
jgi:three-Cys-motif partner protein